MRYRGSIRTAFRGLDLGRGLVGDPCAEAVYHGFGRHADVKGKDEFSHIRFAVHTGREAHERISDGFFVKICKRNGSATEFADFGVIASADLSGKRHFLRNQRIVPRLLVVGSMDASHARRNEIDCIRLVHDGGLTRIIRHSVTVARRAVALIVESMIARRGNRDLFGKPFSRNFCPVYVILLACGTVLVCFVSVFNARRRGCFMFDVSGVIVRIYRNNDFARFYRLPVYEILFAVDALIAVLNSLFLSLIHISEPTRH